MNTAKSFNSKSIIIHSLRQSIWRACYGSATDDAVRKVNNPLLPRSTPATRRR